MYANAARRFLHAAYAPADCVALLLKCHQTGRTAQRVGPLSMVLDPKVHAWLRAMNAQGYSVFISVNTIRPGLRTRSRATIESVRHVFLDADEDVPHMLATLAARQDLPPPSYIVHSSSRRVHVLWRVAGFTIDTVEALQRYLARELGTDPAATPCTQVTRLPGYRNHKYPDVVHVVTADYGPTGSYTPNDFPRVPAAPKTKTTLSRSTRVAFPVDVRERARRYLEHVEPAVAGQHGDLHTFRVCCRIVRGFDLSDDEAFTLLTEWNARAVPPWSESELRRKIASARRNGREPIGALRDRVQAARSLGVNSPRVRRDSHDDRTT